MQALKTICLISVTLASLQFIVNSNPPPPENRTSRLVRQYEEAVEQRKRSAEARNREEAKQLNWEAKNRVQYQVPN